MFFSFSLFPPGISARCSRSALPPGFPPGIPSGGAWLAERFRAPSAFGGLSVFAGVSALRPFSAFPSGISARRLGLRYRLLFPVCVPARHFRPAFGSALPPVVPGLRFRPAFPSGGAWFAERFRAPSAFAGLVRFCTACFLHAVTSAYGKKRACRNPDVGLQRCGACRRDRSFEPAGGSVSGGIRAVRAAKLHIIP